MAKKQIGAAELGIDIASGRDQELFKWFMASFLFAKPIGRDIAARTYEVIAKKHGRDSPHKICDCSWQELVDMLGEGHYRRYDESTATRLLDMCRKLNDEYGGSLERLHDDSGSRAELERRLQSFKGVGPKAVQIFMREAKKVWH